MTVKTYSKKIFRSFLIDTHNFPKATYNLPFWQHLGKEKEHLKKLAQSLARQQRLHVQEQLREHSIYFNQEAQRVLEQQFQYSPYHDSLQQVPVSLRNIDVFLRMSRDSSSKHTTSFIYDTPDYFFLRNGLYIKVTGYHRLDYPATDSRYDQRCATLLEHVVLPTLEFSNSQEVKVEFYLFKATELLTNNLLEPTFATYLQVNQFKELDLWQQIVQEMFKQPVLAQLIEQMLHTSAQAVHAAEDILESFKLSFKNQPIVDFSNSYTATHLDLSPIQVAELESYSFSFWDNVDNELAEATAKLQNLQELALKQEWQEYIQTQQNRQRVDFNDVVTQELEHEFEYISGETFVSSQEREQPLSLEQLAYISRMMQEFYDKVRNAGQAQHQIAPRDLVSYLRILRALDEQRWNYGKSFKRQPQNTLSYLSMQEQARELASKLDLEQQIRQARINYKQVVETLESQVSKTLGWGERQVEVYTHQISNAAPTVFLDPIQRKSLPYQQLNWQQRLEPYIGQPHAIAQLSLQVEEKLYELQQMQVVLQYTVSSASNATFAIAQHMGYYLEYNKFERFMLGSQDQLAVHQPQGFSFYFPSEISVTPSRYNFDKFWPAGFFTRNNAIENVDNLKYDPVLMQGMSEKFGYETIYSSYNLDYSNFMTEMNRSGSYFLNVVERPYIFSYRTLSLGYPHVPNVVSEISPLRKFAEQNMISLNFVEDNEIFNCLAFTQQLNAREVLLVDLLDEIMTTNTRVYEFVHDNGYIVKLIRMLESVYHFAQHARADELEELIPVFYQFLDRVILDLGFFFSRTEMEQVAKNIGFMSIYSNIMSVYKRAKVLHHKHHVPFKRFFNQSAFTLIIILLDIASLIISNSGL